MIRLVTVLLTILVPRLIVYRIYFLWTHHATSIEGVLTFSMGGLTALSSTSERKHIIHNPRSKFAKPLSQSNVTFQLPAR